MGSEHADSWEPPNEDELRAIRERRARSDRISKIMSEYLLKGYRMLASNCNVCGNVMLDDKKGRTFCVNCDELESSQSPALQQKPTTSAGEAPSSSSPQLVVMPVHRTIRSSATIASPTIIEAMVAVEDTLKSATAKLSESNNPKLAVEYTDLIKSCAEALYSLTKLREFKM